MSRFLDSGFDRHQWDTLVVNGVEANGPGVTASAIQSVKINQNPYTALYSRPGRARIEITTKGGTPQLHGSANFLYRNSVFDAKNAFAVTKPSEHRTHLEGSLTGPLSHGKKTTFLLALDKDNDHQQAIVNGGGTEWPDQRKRPQPHRALFPLRTRLPRLRPGKPVLGGLLLRTSELYRIRELEAPCFRRQGPTHCSSSTKSTSATFTWSHRSW